MPTGRPTPCACAWVCVTASALLGRFAADGGPGGARCGLWRRALCDSAERPCRALLLSLVAGGAGDAPGCCGEASWCHAAAARVRVLSAWSAAQLGLLRALELSAGAPGAGAAFARAERRASAALEEIAGLLRGYEGTAQWRDVAFYFPRGAIGGALEAMRAEGLRRGGGELRGRFLELLSRAAAALPRAAPPPEELRRLEGPPPDAAPGRGPRGAPSHERRELPWMRRAAARPLARAPQRPPGPSAITRFDGIGCPGVPAEAAAQAQLCAPLLSEVELSSATGPGLGNNSHHAGAHAVVPVGII